MELDTFSSKKKKSYLRFRKESTAILVVDMINEFMKPGGKMVLKGGHVLIEPVRKLLDKARNAKMRVIYLNDSHRRGVKGEFTKRIRHCIEGTWGTQVIDEIKPRVGDFVIFKRTYSGFFQTDLDLTLRDLGIKTVIVIGVVTNICVRSTIHDAFFRGYKVIVPRDCVMATGEREQESSLYDTETHFGEVTTSGRIMDVMRKRRA